MMPDLCGDVGTWEKCVARQLAKGSVSVGGEEGERVSGFGLQVWVAVITAPAPL